MTLVEELEQWKKDLEELSVEKGRAAGRLEQAMENLKAKGFDTVEAAEAELAKLTDLKEKQETKARLKLKHFKEKYANFIE